MSLILKGSHIPIRTPGYPANDVTTITIAPGMTLAACLEREHTSVDELMRYIENRKFEIVFLHSGEVSFNKQDIVDFQNAPFPLGIQIRIWQREFSS